MTNQNPHLPLPECRIQNETRSELITQKVYGAADRWPELAKLSDISRDNLYRMGDCLKVFDVKW